MATSIFKEYFTGYEILGELGRGNARVLKARSIATGTLVAIKHFAFNTDADTLRRFQRESEIMKSIAHDFIVKIIEVHLDAELPYIVMELIEGGDLRSLLKTHGALDHATVITLTRHMTAALMTIHERNIVHRDIKPENIMYRRTAAGDIEFLLTDFGIARLREQADTITVTGSSMLTYDYASPEQFSQPKMVGAATDYYSFGIVLYECITGRVPFEYEQDDLLGHINRVISASPPIPVQPNGRLLPTGMLHLLEGLLRKQPQNRVCDPASVGRLLQMETVAEPPVERPVKKRRRFPVGLALLLPGIVILFSWSQLRKNNPGNNAAPNTASIVPTPVLQTKQPLPSQAAHVVHTRNTPMVTGGTSATTSNQQGVALTGGMYYNDFDQADSLWSTGRDANSEFILLDGLYTMKGFTDSLSYSSFIKLEMDTEKDFTVTATAIHQGEGSGDPFGIIFCGDGTADAFYVFYITSNGYYSIGSSVKDEWNAFTDWTAASSIRQDTEMNLISIEKRNGLLRFIINGKVEKVLPFPSGFGKYFGLRTDGEQTVSFDQFIVKGSSTANNH